MSFLYKTCEMYQDHKDEKLVGYLEFSRPTVVVNDLEIIKSVLIKDFDHFTDR